ncbi:hypothetical protein SOM26_03580 [Sphingomonas sp. CFBP8993]|uniref:hypothetical protein n=1 Tax=Sphingomonas sp. CFBP8993 TaxID=3096526 RepID=UPI002A6B02C7|nr:hypothetical protein [Sphingomonas sp. CFBP8993]MDY0957760.1 hypothetical protein [Sphingomonas sp. CFBP8993]
MEVTPPVKKVLRAIPPEPDESLVGLVRRCAFENGLPSTGVLLREAVAAPHAWSNLALRDDVDADRLAEAMRTAPGEIDARLYAARRAAPFVGLRGFHGTEVRSFDLRPQLRRIPAALPGTGHHRALWHVATIPFCPQTGEPLFDHCARCERRLEWSAARRLDHCSVCGDAARASRGSRPDEAAFRETSLMTRLLDPRLDARVALEATIPTELHGLGRGAVFDLGWSIARLFDRRVNGTRADDPSLPADVRMDVLRRGAEIIGDWPAALRTMLRGAVADDAARAKQALRGLRSMVAKRTGWPEQAELLGRTVPELIGRARVAIGGLHGPLVNSDDARRELRINPRTLRRLVEKGPFEAIDVTPSRRLCVGLDRAFVERLSVLKTDCASFAEAADQLGITQAGVAQLVDLGELNEHSDPALKLLRHGRQVSRTGLAALRSRIHLRTLPIDAATITLRRAARAIGGEKPWGLILAEAASGALPITSPREIGGSNRLVDRIAIPVSEVPALRLIGDVPQGDGAAELSRIDAADVLNLTPRRLLDALERELRHAVLPDGRLRRDAVLRHARRHMSFAELSIRSGKGRTLVKMLAADGVRRLGVAGWDREAAEAWLKPAPESAIRRDRNGRASVANSGDRMPAT